MSDFAFWDLSPELSRRFRALKIWFALKVHGADAFVSTIERNIELAQRLGTLLDEQPDFERLAAIPLSIVCFRYRGPSMDDDETLNAFNRELMVEVQRDGDVYLSNAVLDGRFALRACIVNHRTTHDDLRRVIATVRRVATMRPSV
jgi:glutamate/tyrosine decarboxylase-like PLP-dependent enzyme